MVMMIMRERMMRVMMRMMFKDAEGELGGPDSCPQPVTFYISRAQKFYPTHIFPMMMRVISFTGDYHDIITVVLLCFEFPARFIFQDYDEALKFIFHQKPEIVR